MAAAAVMFAMARLRVFQQKKDSCKFESQQARAIPRLIRRGLIAQEEIKTRGGRPSPDRVDPIKPIFSFPNASCESATQCIVVICLHSAVHMTGIISLGRFLPLPQIMR